MTPIRKAGALIISEKRLLIVKAFEKPFYINPGGKYNQDETAEHCLKRELGEELQIILTSYKHYRTYKFAKAAHAKEPLLLELYLVAYSGKIAPSSEIEHFEWMDKEDFYRKRFNVAPSFFQYVPDLIKDGLL